MSEATRADVFSAVASPVRRGILVALRSGEKPASELAQQHRMSFAAVSQHLKILRDSQLVSEQRHGRQRIYYLNPEALKELYAWASEFATFWNDKLDALESHLDQTRGERIGVNLGTGQSQTKLMRRCRGEVYSSSRGS